MGGMYNGHLGGRIAHKKEKKGVPTIHSEYMREEQARACACVQASRRGEFVSNCSASLFLYAGTYWRRTCTHTSTHARARAQIHTHQREYAVRTHAYIQEIGCASPLLDSATPSPRIGEDPVESRAHRPLVFSAGANPRACRQWQHPRRSCHRLHQGASPRPPPQEIRSSGGATVCALQAPAPRRSCSPSPAYTRRTHACAPRVSLVLIHDPSSYCGAYTTSLVEGGGSRALLVLDDHAHAAAQRTCTEQDAVAHCDWQRDIPQARRCGALALSFAPFHHALGDLVIPPSPLVNCF